MSSSFELTLEDNARFVVALKANGYLGCISPDRPDCVLVIVTDKRASLVNDVVHYHVRSLRTNPDKTIGFTAMGREQAPPPVTLDPGLRPEKGAQLLIFEQITKPDGSKVVEAHRLTARIREVRVC